MTVTLNEERLMAFVGKAIGDFGTHMVLEAKP